MLVKDLEGAQLERDVPVTASVAPKDLDHYPRRAEDHTSGNTPRGAPGGGRDSDDG